MLNLVPYKDFFYPYGLIFYLKAGEVGWYIASLIINISILIIVFVTFRSIFRDKKYVYTFYISFCLFIAIFIDLDTFLRYAPLIVFISITSYYANKNKLVSVKSGLVIGLVLGLFFSFINDLFLYSVGTYAFFLAIYIILNKKIDKESIRHIAYHLGFLLVGLSIGTLPIAIYLYLNNSIGDYISYYLSLKDIYQLAKVPFPPSLKSVENILIIFSIIFSIFFLFEQVKMKKFNTRFYFMLALAILILFLEQKNITRSFYTQISFFSFIIFLILLDEFRLRIKNRIEEKYIFLYILNLMFMIYLIIIFDRNFILVKSKNIFSGWNISYCLNDKINNLDPNELKPYIRVRDYLINDKPACKIFSFPGDPIFYQLFNQKSPYYPSIYEATPVYAQQN